MTILKDFNISQIIKIVSVFVIIVSASYALAVAVNSFIAYKFFSIPQEQVKPKKIQEEQSKNYRYLGFLFEKISVPAPDIAVPPTQSADTGIPVSSTEPILQTKDIKLVGTILSDKERIALLMVDKELKMVKKNQKIENLKVKSIDRFTVVLTDGIKDYKISIDISSSRTHHRRRYEKPIARTTPVRKEEVQTKTEGEGDYYEISKREVEKHTADLGKLLKYVRIVPVVKNGETKGYKFLYVSPRSILYKYGLRSGDFIVSVNGMSVKTAEEAFKVYNILRNEKTIRLEIERKGERKVITYQIK